MGAGIDMDAFRWRLAETIAWCAKHASLDNPKDCLRNDRWRPPAFWYPNTVYPPHTIVEALVKERAKELRDWRGNSSVKEPANDLGGGRLFIYYPYANLADGAAEVETNGFLDAENEPPWDTWLCFVDDPKGEDEQRDLSHSSYLLSWIPPQFIELVNEGININPEGCILWATQVDTPFTRELKEADLVD